MFSAANVASYEQVLSELGKHIEGVHRIDRAQIDRSHRLSFSINGTTWCEFNETGFRRRYALDDTSIPLAQWASRQPPKSILVLAYRPGKRLVVKDLSRDLVIKGYREGKSSLPADYHSIATAALASVDGVKVAQLLKHDHSLSAIELMFCPLRPMHIVQDSESDIERIGAAIGSFQEAVPNLTRLTIPRWKLADELQTLLNWCAKVEAVGIQIPQQWTATFNCLVSQVPESRQSVLTHRDLHDGQWLKARSELCLLDFDSLCLAHPLLDLGNYAAHIDLRYLQSARTDAGPQSLKQKRLLHGYAQLSGADLSSLGWFRSVSLLRLALVYAIRPRWRHLTGRLIARASTLGYCSTSEEL